MRAFVAVEVPPGDPRVPGAGSAPSHLTLRFLGEIGADRIEPIARALEPVARRFAAFDARAEGIGAFPSAAAPRVVWIGVGQGSQEIGALANAVRDALSEERLPPAEARFVPHVTWFRVRSAADRRTAIDLLEGRRAAPPPRPFRVREFVLKESVLGRGGAVHRTLATFHLSGDLAPPSALAPTPPSP